MTQQKTIAAVFAAGALAGGFTGATIEGQPAEVRAVVAEDIYGTPDASHVERLRARVRCDVTSNANGVILTDGCDWHVLARTRVPALIAGVQDKVDAASFSLGDRADLQPIIAPMIAAAEVKLCATVEAVDCKADAVNVAPERDGGSVVTGYSVSVAGLGDGERIQHDYSATPETLGPLVTKAIDVLCQTGGLCAAAATVPVVDGGV